MDFKKTLNKQLNVDQYPLPKIEDILSSLSGGVVFTVLDLSDAYTQLELVEESKPYVTINTHKGLFRFNRLVYGIASAPSIFQQTMDKILSGLEGVKCYLDDILITGGNFQECFVRTSQVLSQLSKYSVSVKFSKCEWFVLQVNYLGFVISKEGRLCVKVRRRLTSTDFA